MRLSIGAFLLAMVLVASGRGQVVLSEFMFDPLQVGGAGSTAGGAEYIELFNRSGEEVDIGGWRVYDGTGRVQGTIPKWGRIGGGMYVAIASDSSIFRRFPYLRDSSNVIVLDVSSFSLNAEGDLILVREGSGANVDSVRYDDEWHRRELGEMKGVALERISMSGEAGDRRNWSSSVASLGGTPGARNSVEIPPGDPVSRLTAIPSTISPDGDGFEDFTRILYRLPAPTSRIIVTVHDRYGRPVRRLANNEPAASEGELIWDGRDDDGRPLAMGFYLLYLEAYDDGGGGLATARGTIVIAKKL